MRKEYKTSFLRQWKFSWPFFPQSKNMPGILKRALRGLTARGLTARQFAQIPSALLKSFFLPLDQPKLSGNGAGLPASAGSGSISKGLTLRSGTLRTALRPLTARQMPRRQSLSVALWSARGLPPLCGSLSLLEVVGRCRELVRDEMWSVVESVCGSGARKAGTALLLTRRLA